MRRLLLALPFTLLPPATGMAASSHAHDAHAQADHGQLEAHDHGVAQLDVVLDGQVLELQLTSPAINLVGFEHLARSAADQAKVAAARHQLEQPQALFGLSAADCRLNQQELHSPLFAAPAHEHEHQHEDPHEHAEDSAHRAIQAHYSLNCQNPEKLQQLDLRELFKRFPATEKIQVQLIGPNGQQGLQLTPAQPTLSF